MGNKLPLSKILNFAEREESVKIVLMNGSRVNPNIVADSYADYDILFATENPEKFSVDTEWIYDFGELLILQENKIKEKDAEWRIFLMQFSDGLRIDLSFYPLDKIRYMLSDSLTKVLLDKDGMLGEIDEPSERSYFTKMPSEEEYYETLNEFWWCIINTAKGAARKELTYSRFMYESIVRKCFLKIIYWYIGFNNRWKANPGKYGKFMEKYLAPDIWIRIKKTYNGNGFDSFWPAIYEICGLVTEFEEKLSKGLGYKARKEKGKEIIEFIRKIETGKI